MPSTRSLPLVLLACLSLGAAACLGATTSPTDTTSPPTAPTSPPTAPTTPPTPTSTPVACAATVTTTLPGVTVRVTSERCDFTLAQAAAGIKVDYELVIDKDLPTLYTQSPVTGEPQTQLQLFAVLSGQGQKYCLCDTGPRPSGINEVLVAAGTYPGSFEWDGKNWNGPSDTRNEKGPAFPAGAYVLKLHGAGAHAEPAADAPFVNDYTIDVTLPITLLE